MYRLFDEELRRRKLNLETAMVNSETKAYTNISKMDGNNVKTLFFINESNIFHTAITRVVENIPTSKLIDFHKLANKVNNDYVNIRCLITEENHFDVHVCYTASEDCFSAELFIEVLASYLDTIRDDVFPSAMRLKYSF